jgi:hypothetical protein
VINRESLALLAKTKGVINFGFESVTLKVYRKDEVDGSTAVDTSQRKGDTAPPGSVPKEDDDDRSSVGSEVARRFATLLQQDSDVSSIASSIDKEESMDTGLFQTVRNALSMAGGSSDSDGC